MAKFFGSIGFITSSETSPGVYTNSIIEREYKGDIVRKSYKWQSADKVNDDISVNQSISIVSDGYANENFYAMRYVRWNGACWKITDVEVNRPRMTLTIGGLYNGV